MSAPDGVLSEDEVLALLRARVAEVGGQRPFARATGIALSLLNRVLMRRDAVGPAVAAVVGYRPMRVFVPLEGDKAP